MASKLISPLQQEFEHWVVNEFPLSITSSTFNKLFTNEGTFICYTVDVVDKMWRSWEGSRGNSL